MRIYNIAVLLSLLLFFGCNNGDKQKIKDLSDQDSTLMLKTKGQDSTIMAYVRSFNDIQDNLDSIKAKAKIITVTNGSESADKKDQIIADMKYISEMMMKNKKEIASLERKLKKSNGTNAELQKMIAHLTQEVTEKDAEIASLQSQLAETMLH
jgi:predicted nuclease with TOPRIM domain